MIKPTDEKIVEDLIDEVERERRIHENPAGLLEFDREDLTYLVTLAYLKGLNNE